LNNNTDADPAFDGGAFLQVGLPGFKLDIDVGARATPTVVDWNNDNRKDLVVGALDGKISIFLNEGTDTSPDFRSQMFAQDGGADLVVLSSRSSPDILDLDGDGRKDLLTGNTSGQLLFYTNTASDASPSFSGYVFVESAGVVIDLPLSARSRPFICDWTGDGLWDVLIGGGDGLVYLYQTVLGDVNCDGLLNTTDVDPFVLVLLDPLGPHACRANRADCNGDGIVDGRDIQPFADLLLAGP
jgi:hypothetical protein